MHREPPFLACHPPKPSQAPLSPGLTVSGSAGLETLRGGSPEFSTEYQMIFYKLVLSTDTPPKHLRSSLEIPGLEISINPTLHQNGLTI